MSIDSVPAARQRDVNDAPMRADAKYVLYWMVGTRRTHSNFALQLAVQWGEKLGIPVLVFEPVRVGYRWASDRFHAFILQGMADNEKRLQSTPVGYFPYVEPEEDADKGLLEALAEDAALIVTDEQPGFFQPRMIASAGSKIGVKMIAVDSVGLLPLSVPDRTFTRAYSFRRYLQKTLPDHLLHFPDPDPIAGSSLPAFEGMDPRIEKRWPRATPAILAAEPSAIGALPIDHAVGIVEARGGPKAGRARMEAFVDGALDGYGEARNHPDGDGSSRLSPYLHFGHVGVHEVVARMIEACDWTVDRLADQANGKREGWWGMPPAYESFLDEIVTWREIGYVECHRNPAFDRYESLPAWAKKTLAEHASDARPHLYDYDELEQSKTGDEIWNAAQRELVRTGHMHNYLRMLWGKRILEWTSSPRVAFDTMVELNNKWALDGRDPNSYSGILWVLGKFDRAWGPERPVFGKIRFMSSDSTRRKLKLRRYLERFCA
jgi:deoxyribodipyrimidine photo-lyase